VTAGKMRPRPRLYASRKEHNRTAHALNGNTARFNRPGNLGFWDDSVETEVAEDIRWERANRGSDSDADLVAISDVGDDVECILMGGTVPLMECRFCSELIRSALSRSVGASCAAGSISFRTHRWDMTVTVVLHSGHLGDGRRPRPGLRAPFIVVVDMESDRDRIRRCLEELIAMSEEGAECYLILANVDPDPDAIRSLDDLLERLTHAHILVCLAGARAPTWDHVTSAALDGAGSLSLELAEPPWIDRERLALLSSPPATWAEHMPLVPSSPAYPLELAEGDPWVPAVCLTTHQVLWSVELCGLLPFRGIWFDDEATLADLHLAVMQHFGLVRGWRFACNGRPLASGQLLHSCRGSVIRATELVCGGARATEVSGEDAAAPAAISAEGLGQRVPLDVEDRFPAGPAQLTESDPAFVEVLADGRCGWYTAVAAVDVSGWRSSHAANGAPLTPEVAAADIAAANDLRDRVAGLMRADGKEEEADRLYLAGDPGYPDEETLPYLGQALGGSIVVLTGQYQVAYGGGPAVLLMESCVARDPAGHGAPHFRLRQSWLLVTARSSEGGLDRATGSGGPVAADAGPSRATKRRRASGGVCSGAASGACASRDTLESVAGRASAHRRADESARSRSPTATRGAASTVSPPSQVRPALVPASVYARLTNDGELPRDTGSQTPSQATETGAGRDGRDLEALLESAIFAESLRPMSPLAAEPSQGAMEVGTAGKAAVQEGLPSGARWACSARMTEALAKAAPREEGALAVGLARKAEGYVSASAAAGEARARPQASRGAD